MRIRIGIPLLSLLYTLTACGSDPKAPSEANFRKAINAVLVKKNPYCGPLLEGRGARGLPPSPLADAVGKIGLLTHSNGDTYWVVSDAGMKLIPAGTEVGGAGWYSYKPCIADGAEVAKVVNWTEPSNIVGTTFSKVKYTIKPTKLAPWVTPDIAALIPQLHDEKERVMSMVLTAKGWEKAE